MAGIPMPGHAMPGAGAWPVNPGMKWKGAFDIPELEGEPLDTLLLLALFLFILFVSTDSLTNYYDRQTTLSLSAWLDEAN